MGRLGGGDSNGRRAEVGGRCTNVGVFRHSNIGKRCFFYVSIVSCFLRNMKKIVTSKFACILMYWMAFQ